MEDPDIEMLREAIDEAYELMLSERVAMQSEREDTERERKERLDALERLRLRSQGKPAV